MFRNWRMILTVLTLAASWALPGAVARAESSSPGVAPSLSVRISPETAVARAVNTLTPTPDGYLLSHPRYAVRFDSQGITMTPRTGPQWKWRFVGAGPATAGSESARWIVSGAGEVGPQGQEESGVVYARGPVEERYLFRGDHVEQQFVLNQPLASPVTDLELVGEIGCEGRLESGSDGWLWRTNGGVVSLGHVRVYDARGRELPARMDVVARETRITIDGPALAEAVYPVTVDPEIGTNDFRLSDMGIDGDITFDGQKSAVAYNSANNEYLVAWEGDDNVAGLVEGEFEIFGQRIDAGTGAEIGANDFRISDMGPAGDATRDAVAPAVAYNGVSNEYLVVWSGDDGTGTMVNGEYEIFGQRIGGSTGLEVGTNDFRISDMGLDGFTAWDAADPDVAYDQLQNEYLVVWSGDDAFHGEFEIYGQRISGATGAEVGANDFRISDMGPDSDPLYDAESPRAAYAQSRGEYLVVWQGDDNTGLLANGEFEVFGQRLNATTCAEVGVNDFRISDMGPDGDANYDALDPAVTFAGAENKYAVVWSGDDASGTLVAGEREIFMQFIDGTTGLEIGSNDVRVSQMGPDGDPLFDAEAPAVVYNGVTHEFLIAWYGDTSGGGLSEGELEIFGQRINALSGAQLGGNDFQLSDMGRPGSINVGAFRPAIAVTTSATSEYIVTWHADQDTLGLSDEEFEIYGQRVRASNGSLTGTVGLRFSDMGPDGDIDYDARSAAVAYNPVENEYLVVWEGDDDTGTLVDGETEIFAQRVNATTGVQVGASDVRISDMGNDGDPAYDAQKPAVAYNSTNHEYLVVWSGEDNLGTLVLGEFEIFGQRLDAASGFEVGTNDFRISDMGPDSDPIYDALSSAIVYNPVNNEYLVVWDGDDLTGTIGDEEFEIFAQRLAGATCLPVGDNDFRVSDMGPDGDPNFDALVPAAAFSAASGQYLVTWAGEDNIGLLVSGEFEIYGQLLAANGAPVGANDFRISMMGNDGDPTYDGFAPAVAFDSADNQFLVVWEGDDILGLLANGEFEIFGQRLSSAGVALGTDDFRISDLGVDGDPLLDAERPSVAYNTASNEYLVVWAGDDGTAPLVNGESEIWGQRISAATGLEIGDNDFRLSDVGLDGDAFRDGFEPGVAFAQGANEYLVIWQGDDDGYASNQDEFEIYAQLFANSASADVGDDSSNPGNRDRLQVNPNPMRGPTRIQASRPGAGQVELSLVDVSGRLVLARKASADPSGRVEWSLNASELPGGVYLLRASAGGKTVTKKVVVAQ